MTRLIGDTQHYIKVFSEKDQAGNKILFDPDDDEVQINIKQSINNTLYTIEEDNIEKISLGTYKFPLFVPLLDIKQIVLEFNYLKDNFQRSERTIIPVTWVEKIMCKKENMIEDSIYFYLNLQSSKIKFSDDLTPQIDGVTSEFFTSNNFVSGSTQVYHNGIRLNPNIHYTEVDNNKINLIEIPDTNDNLLMDYEKLI